MRTALLTCAATLLFASFSSLAALENEAAGRPVPLAKAIPVRAERIAEPACRLPTGTDIGGLLIAQREPNCCGTCIIEPNTRGCLITMSDGRRICSPC
jgi:hypothetical protein